MRESLAGPAEAAGVELLGSRSDVADLLRQSDIMVFPSRPAGEGMPGVLIEAGLSGVPVVATDVPGVRTVVADGETGLVVAQDDLAAMVDGHRTLLADPALRTDDGTGGPWSLPANGSASARWPQQWLDLLSPLLPGPLRD